jgi:hypothetical protein
VGTASTSVTLKIDTTAPTIAVNFPTNSMVFLDSEVTLTGTVTDDLSGVSDVTCNFVPMWRRKKRTFPSTSGGRLQPRCVLRRQSRTCP